MVQMISRRGLALLVPFSLLFSFAACGGSSPDAGTATPRSGATGVPSATASASNEDAFAESMLITRDDVPEDYLEKKKANDEVATLADVCGRAAQSGVTGRAVGDDFLFDGQSPAFSEVVTVFASEAEARASVAAVPAYIECALRSIDGGKLDGDGTTFSDAKSTEISVDAAGDTAYAVQIEATKAFAGQSARGVAQYTLVFASKGRAVYEISLRGSGEPPDLEEVTTVTQNAGARIRQR